MLSTSSYVKLTEYILQLDTSPSLKPAIPPALPDTTIVNEVSSQFEITPALKPQTPPNVALTVLASIVEYFTLQFEISPRITNYNSTIST